MITSWSHPLDVPISYCFEPLLSGKTSFLDWERWHLALIYVWTWSRSGFIIWIHFLTCSLNWCFLTSVWLLGTFGLEAGLLYSSWYDGIGFSLQSELVTSVYLIITRPDPRLSTTRRPCIRHPLNCTLGLQLLSFISTWPNFWRELLIMLDDQLTFRQVIVRRHDNIEIAHILCSIVFMIIRCNDGRVGWDTWSSHVTNQQLGVTLRWAVLLTKCVLVWSWAWSVLFQAGVESPCTICSQGLDSSQHLTIVIHEVSFIVTGGED